MSSRGGIVHYIKNRNATKALILGDVEFCHEYFQPGIKSPVFLEFGLGGAEISKRMTRGEPTFFMPFSRSERSCLEVLFVEYIRTFRP